MWRRGGLGRSMALAALASALAWSSPTIAREAELETGSTPSERFAEHEVEPGETVWEIADHYGVSVASVLRENEIDEPSKIWVGTRLRIPIRGTAERAPDAEQNVDAEDSGATNIAALLGRCEAELRAARFERALASAAEARDRIDARNHTADGPDRVRLELASATAYVALGQNDAALESFERALSADPDLELDPELTSPKVLAVFRVARGRAIPAR